MELEFKILGSTDAAVLNRVAADVFDHTVDSRLAEEFVNDPRHHLAVALDDGTVVGIASAVHYVHPDKEPELWINEVGVAPTHQRRGVARRLLEELLRHAASLGCREAWVLTSRGNQAAMKLYATVGGVEAPEDPVMFEIKLLPKKIAAALQNEA